MHWTAFLFFFFFFFFFVVFFLLLPAFRNSITSVSKHGMATWSFLYFPGGGGVFSFWRCTIRDELRLVDVVEEAALLCMEELFWDWVVLQIELDNSNTVAQGSH